jgi:dipeptidyl aminopeptidase/acylaminoacyl peptidase
LDAGTEEQNGKRVLATAVGPVYVPTADPARGYILFVREETLLAQPFNASRLEPAGEPLMVADRVLYNRTGGYFSASPTGILAYRSGASAGPRLAWFDRDGKFLGAAGEPALYNGVAISPDGTRLAAGRRGIEDAQGGIWLVETSSQGASNRLNTISRFGSGSPVWSPDGARVAFSNSRPPALFVMLANGAGTEQPLLESPDRVIAHDWSPDGRYLLYSVTDRKTKTDLWILPDPAAPGDHKPMPYLKTDSNESHGQFSPDGRWIAYASDEIGPSEVFVRPFPDSSGGKRQISVGGGGQPRWRRDGRELFYLSPDRKLMAVEVAIAAQVLKFGIPKPLFSTPLSTAGGVSHRWDVTADGKRMVFDYDISETSSIPITVVLNWTAGLKPRP